MQRPGPKIGIALSGGTFKAAAHVGVLAALEKLGVIPDCLAGTSAGSVVAALHAHGMSTRDMERMVKSFPTWSLLDYGFPITSSIYSLAKQKWFRRPLSNGQVPSGLLRGHRLKKYFAKSLEGRHPTKPFYVVATDLISGKPVVFSNDQLAIDRGIAHSTNDIAAVITASCALPGVFSPVPIENWMFIDGAFRHYVPVEILRTVGCEKIIAVNLYNLEPSWTPATVFHVLIRSFDILLQETIDNDVEGHDLLTLQPLEKKASWSSFASMQTCLEAGRLSVWRNRVRIAEFLQTPPSDVELSQERNYGRPRIVLG